jgi:CRP-like cAMP-binding protein
MITGQEERSFAKGDIIFNEATRPDGVYIVRDGLVEIFQTVRGQEVPLGRIGPRGMFGEMGLIDHQPRSASARALAPTTVLFIPSEAFEEHLEQLPPWVTLMIKNLVRRLRDTNHLLREALEHGGLPTTPSHEWILSSGDDEHHGGEILRHSDK